LAKFFSPEIWRGLAEIGGLGCASSNLRRKLHSLSIDYT
jgi:hypothetical protein